MVFTFAVTVSLPNSLTRLKMRWDTITLRKFVTVHVSCALCVTVSVISWERIPCRPLLYQMGMKVQQSGGGSVVKIRQDFNCVGLYCVKFIYPTECLVSISSSNLFPLLSVLCTLAKVSIDLASISSRLDLKAGMLSKKSSAVTKSSLFSEFEKWSRRNFCSS